MGNVFVLGSGFSASCGLPTQAELFSQMFATPGANSEDIRDVKKALRFPYPHLQKTPSWYDGFPSFEEFISLVTVFKDFEETQVGAGDGYFPPQEWGNVERSALNLLARCLTAKTRKATEGSGLNIKKGIEAVKRFAEIIKPGDKIITFNWDPLVEQYLPVGPKTINGPAVSLLKLHLLMKHRYCGCCGSLKR